VNEQLAEQARPVRAAPNQSVQHAFAVLKLFAASPGPLGVVEISKELRLPLGTCHRVLTTMRDAGYVAQQSDGGKYTTGLQVRELLLALLSSFPIRKVAGPYLHALSELTGLSCVLAVPLGAFSLRISGVQDRQVLHRPLQLGVLTPLNEGSGSLAILASLPEDRIRRYLESLPADDNGPVADVIEQVRLAGFAFCETPLLNSVAVPVRDSQGFAVASVALEGAPVNLARPSGWTIDVWRSVLEGLEDRCAADPEIGRGPFGHLDSSSIELVATTAPVTIVEDRTRN
jgi:DNA-binding IclR family transcriptional regulator